MRLLLNTKRKSYIGSPTASLDLTINEREGSLHGLCGHLIKITLLKGTIKEGPSGYLFECKVL